MRIFIKISSCLLMILVLYGFFNFIFYKRFSNALQRAEKIPVSTWEKNYQDVKLKNKYKAVLVINDQTTASYGEYFKFSAERIGWEALILDKQTLGNENQILAFNPDFIIFNYNTNPDVSPRILAHHSRKYILSFEPIQALRDNGYIDIISPYKAKNNLAEFNKISDAVLTSATQINIFKKMFTTLNKAFYGLKILPLAPRMDNDPAEPKRLHLNVTEYSDLIAMLDKTLPIKLYGQYNPEFKHYQGYTKLGVENIDAIRKDGIFLNLGGPSLGLFEAASANVIIITARDNFIIENFADNILYYDPKQDAKTIYKQIKAHLEWIQNNPQKAKTMAEAAHQIFNEKFSLEKDLVRIAKMHEYIYSRVLKKPSSNSSHIARDHVLNKDKEVVILPTTEKTSKRKGNAKRSSKNK